MDFSYIQSYEHLVVWHNPDQRPLTRPTCWLIIIGLTANYYIAIGDRESTGVTTVMTLTTPLFYSSVSSLISQMIWCLSSYSVGLQLISLADVVAAWTSPYDIQSGTKDNWLCWNQNQRTQRKFQPVLTERLHRLLPHRDGRGGYVLCVCVMFSRSQKWPKWRFDMDLRTRCGEMASCQLFPGLCSMHSADSVSSENPSCGTDSECIKHTSKEWY